MAGESGTVSTCPMFLYQPEIHQSEIQRTAVFVLRRPSLAPDHFLCFVLERGMDERRHKLAG